MATDDAQESGRWGQLGQILQAAAAVLVLLGTLATGFVWLTGGFRPQTQVAVENLTSVVADLRSQVTDLAHKITEMPRIADYATHDAHLARLDAQVGTLNDRVTRDEISSETTRTRVEELRVGSGAPIRIPR